MEGMNGDFFFEICDVYDHFFTFCSKRSPPIFKTKKEYRNHLLGHPFYRWNNDLWTSCHPLVLFPVFQTISKTTKIALLEWFNSDAYIPYFCLRLLYSDFFQQQNILLFLFFSKENKKTNKVFFIDGSLSQTDVKKEIQIKLVVKAQCNKKDSFLFFIEKKPEIKLSSWMQNITEIIDLVVYGNKQTKFYYVYEKEYCMRSSLDDRKHTFLIALRWKNGAYFHVLKYIALYL